MKIAHLSDLHICTSGKHTNIKKTAYILDFLLENNYDHIIITGDITENGSGRDLKAARKIFKEYGVLSSEKLTLLPGNHDIYGGIDRAEDILLFPSRCRKTDYEKKMQKFFDIFSEAFDNTVQFPSGSFFPFVKEFKEALLVGINTVDRYSKLKNPFAANGRVSKEEFRQLGKMLGKMKKAEKPLIMLSHHHYYKYPFSGPSRPNLWNRIEMQTMKLRGRKDLVKCFEKYGVRLVLHGHIHEMAEYWKKGIRFLNAGNTFSSIYGKKISFYSLALKDGMISSRLVLLPRSKQQGTSSGVMKVINL